MRPRRSLSGSTIMAATLASGALVVLAAGRSCASADDHDELVPPGVARDVVELDVDLSHEQRCEESFDLALYRNRAIERIDWDDNKRSCGRRRVTIHYLRDRIGREGVERAAREAERGRRR